MESVYMVWSIDWPINYSLEDCIHDGVTKSLSCVPSPAVGRLYYIYTALNSMMYDMEQ